MNGGNLEMHVATIGAREQAVQQFRQQVAGAVLPEIAAVDYGNAVAIARMQSETFPDGQPQIQLNPGQVAHVTMAYTDALLLQLGLIRPN